jgi:hypothetical protein
MHSTKCTLIRDSEYRRVDKLARARERQRETRRQLFKGELVRIHHFTHPWGIRVGWYIPVQFGQTNAQYLEFALEKLLTLGTALEEADHPYNDYYRGDRGEPN